MESLRIRRYVGASLFTAVLLAGGAPRANAQYFGQNKVQYQTFDFRVLRTQHFDVYYYPEEHPMAITAGRMAERWYARLSNVLHDSLNGRQPLILYASAAAFRQTNAISGDLGEGTGGVTEAYKRRIVLPFGSSLDETDHVLGHELVHAFQYDISGRGPGGAAGGALALPLWFIEGMAEYFSLGPVDANTAMWLRDAVQRNDLPRIKDLENPKYFPYRYGQAFWAYVGGRYGDDKISDLLRAGIHSRDPMVAIRTVLSIDPDSLSEEWHRSIVEAAQAQGVSSAPRVVVSPPGTGPASALLTRASTGGTLNLGPSLSPDGSKIAFLSERSRYSIDLYVADAVTGRVLRRITQSAVDPHLESLQFIYSAGAWHPDGRQFMVAAQVNGRPALEIYNMDNGHQDREIRLQQLDEIFNPSFSPDGGKVVFTAHVGGLTDLYTYDLAANDLQRLTNDAYADLEPAWSPDGHSIAFVTDRFTTDTTALRYGRYRLALVDVASGRMTQLPGFDTGKQINPQWSANGRELFFLADPDGITNVYRLDIGSSTLFRVTDLATGAAGITALSPALSVAGDRMAVSVYKDGGAEVFKIEAAGTSGHQVSGLRNYESAATLPPVEGRVESQVSHYLSDAATGLPAAAEFSEARYRQSFGLDYIAQPSLSVGTDRFGTFVGGGAAMFWSSMTGDRQLATMLQVNGRIQDVSAGVSYVNLKHRWDWALQVSQVPYITGGYGQFLDTLGGRNVVVEQQVIERQINREAGLVLQYPFNRAQRLELGASAREVSFNGEQTEAVYDYATGQPISVNKSDLAAPDPLWLGQSTAALVFDNSLFGGTGPVLGQRWRLEASPMFGSINFVSALADYRKYFMVRRSVTLATRVVHFGRYGSGAEDPRLSPLYLGYQSLVRGYDNASFSPRECRPTATDGCPAYNNLLGSKVLVGNAELRIALLGPLGIGARGFLPLDLAFFADGGVAWMNGVSPAMFGGTRPAVSSIGTGLRMNLFGFAIGEVDLVHPMNRPDKPWYVQFGFNPGF